MPIGRIVFLPLFFTYSGLNTRFALLADPKLLLFAVLCVVVAIVGKLGACWARRGWWGSRSRSRCASARSSTPAG